MGVDYIKTPSGILKMVEILFVIIALSIYRGVPASFGSTSFDGTSPLFVLNDGDVFGAGVLVTAMTITPLLLIIYLTHSADIQKTFLEVSLNLLLGLFFLAAGSTAINTWTSQTPGKFKDGSLTMGSFCLFASFAYIGDGVLNVLSLRGGGEE